MCVSVCVDRGGRSNLFAKIPRWCKITDDSFLLQGFSGAGVFPPVFVGCVTTLQWGDGFGVLALLGPRVDLCRDLQAYSLSLELLSQVVVEKNDGDVVMGWGVGKDDEDG